jgi:hypothetical protein
MNTFLRHISSALHCVVQMLIIHTNSFITLAKENIETLTAFIVWHLKWTRFLNLHFTKKGSLEISYNVFGHGVTSEGNYIQRCFGIVWLRKKETKNACRMLAAALSYVVKILSVQVRSKL